MKFHRPPHIAQECCHNIVCSVYLQSNMKSNAIVCCCYDNLATPSESPTAYFAVVG